MKSFSGGFCLIVLRVLWLFRLFYEFFLPEKAICENVKKTNKSPLPSIPLVNSRRHIVHLFTTTDNNNSRPICHIIVCDLITPLEEEMLRCACAKRGSPYFSRQNFTVILLKGALLKAQSNEGGYLPVVLWHGMGDSCCFFFSLGAFQKKLKQALPNVHILSLKIGNSLADDVENSYFLHPNKQIDLVCEKIKNDPLLSNGFNAIGFSQGGQFLRGLVQRCPEAKVRNLVSLGGQHQGVYGLPNCGSLSNKNCDYVRRLLNHAAYFSWVQKALVQATYWHDPLNEAEYKRFSTFLSDINNEQTINRNYINNLQNVTNLVLVKFKNDTIVQPVATEWFGFYKSGQSVQIENLEQSSLYLEDRLGLKKLNGEGRLYFLETPGNHLQFEWTWFQQNVVEPFLKH